MIQRQSPKAKKDQRLLSKKNEVFFYCFLFGDKDF